MQKSKTYWRTRFDGKTIAADEAFGRLSSQKRKYKTLEVPLGDSVWTFDTLPEFLAAMEQSPKYTLYVMDYDGSKQLQVNHYSGSTTVWVLAADREEIERVFSIFEADADRSRLAHTPSDDEKGKVFIGHGRSTQWRDLKDHLHDKHGYSIEAYEIGSRAGHTIRDILEEMLASSSVALLVMTGEDEDKEGKLHARENVVHETGLFQGRLGFSRAVVLLEDGTQEFSNISGIQQIRYGKGNVKEAFGEVLAFLKRELG